MWHAPVVESLGSSEDDFSLFRNIDSVDRNANITFHHPGTRRRRVRIDSRHQNPVPRVFLLRNLLLHDERPHDLVLELDCPHAKLWAEPNVLFARGGLASIATEKQLDDGNWDNET